MTNQAKLRSFRTAPRYKYGFEVPRSYKYAFELDARNGNNKWQEAIDLEFAQIQEYNTFIDYGINVTPPIGFKKICIHFVFDVKHDGWHKARLVADGHLTEIPVDSVHSGVVSLREIRLVLFLAELNQIPIWGADIGNAYLEAMTKEKLYIIGGPEFGDLKSHALIISRAFYGLRISGLRWHERLADCLKDIGFIPCKIENIYEYVGVMWMT